jgi:hypothetical protein
MNVLLIYFSLMTILANEIFIIHHGFSTILKWICNKIYIKTYALTNYVFVVDTFSSCFSGLEQ